MEDIKLSSEEIRELKDIITWAIGEGYITNETTKQLAHKISIGKDTMEYLDKNCNVGISLTE